MIRRITAQQDDLSPITMIETRSPEETSAVGARLARALRKGDVLTLEGGLGSGKTVLARGLISALAGSGQTIPSPTFTLVQIYETPAFELWHCDLYRLDGPEATVELGLEEGADAGVLLVEWPDRLGDLLPFERLRITFEFSGDDTSRRISFDGSSRWRARLTGLLDADA